MDVSMGTISVVLTLVSQANDLRNKIFKHSLDKEVTALVNGLLDINSQLNGIVNTIHAELMANTEELNALREKLKEYDDWAIEKEKYIPIDIQWGTLAFVRDPNAQPHQPAHWICAHCYDKKQTGRLAKMHKSFAWYCLRCKAEFYSQTVPKQTIKPSQ